LRHVPLQQNSFVPHAIPHPPQLASSYCNPEQVPLQHDWPAPHGEHDCPHAAGLLLGSTHEPPQFCVPGGHTTVHRAPEHTVPDAHALPHAPQFAPLLARSTHPLGQRVKPIGHAHAPPTHASPGPHDAPHAPQLATSLCRSTQPAPFSHADCPSGHTHALLTQRRPVAQG
jgi:hypothetical protein